jgi:hypothetical protein
MAVLRSIVLVNEEVSGVVEDRYWKCLKLVVVAGIGSI